MSILIYEMELLTAYGVCLLVLEFPVHYFFPFFVPKFSIFQLKLVLYSQLLSFLDSCFLVTLKKLILLL